ncbi:VOC family protein [Dactylosporangium cerinum]
MITLGVADVRRATAFYESLGWHVDSGIDDDTDQITFFQAGGVIVSLWDRGKLADDGAVVDGGGWGGVTLGHNVGSPQEVDEIIAAAKVAGATITRAGTKMFWGGYSGVFADPDGHTWEVAHNPAWRLHDDGSVTL